METKVASFDASIDFERPHGGFWEKYAELWRNSTRQSVFQAPHFIQYLMDHASDSVATFKVTRQDSSLIGAAFFQKNGGKYQFLSDLKTDHNFFVIRKERTEEEIKYFFDLFLDQVKTHRWALDLNFQPTWASYWDIMQAAIKESGFFTDSVPYTVCPVFDPGSTQALLKRLSKSKNTKYKRNKLRKNHGAAFEVFTDDEDLDNWTEGFVESHAARWAQTNTPSEYQSEEGKQFLKDCMKAWLADDILVRFSIKLEDESRVAYCIGLKEGDALIHHSHTYDVSYGKYSPGKVLLAFMGEWMVENDLAILDFGDGNEPFKYNYANLELKMKRIFVSPYSRIPFILRAKTIKMVRNNERLYQLYLNKVKPYLPAV